MRKPRFDFHIRRQPVDHEKICRERLVGCVNLNEGIARLRGQDLITAASLLKQQFGVTDEKFCSALGW